MQPLQQPTLQPTLPTASPGGGIRARLRAGWRPMLGAAALAIGLPLAAAPAWAQTAAGVLPEPRASVHDGAQTPRMHDRVAPAAAAVSPPRRDAAAAIAARYQAERQACLDGRSGQDRATCLKEAGAARAEALRRRLDNGEDRRTLDANAVRRCAVQPPAEQAACELLARGQGVEQGSVRDGAVLKSVVTRSVGRSGAAPVAPGAAAAPAAGGASGG